MPFTTEESQLFARLFKYLAVVAIVLLLLGALALLGLF